MDKETLALYKKKIKNNVQKYTILFKIMFTFGIEIANIANRLVISIYWGQMTSLGGHDEKRKTERHLVKESKDVEWKDLKMMHDFPSSTHI